MSIAHEHVLARLHMNAVLPCLPALTRLDDTARTLLEGHRFAVQLKTRSGLRSRLDLLGEDRREDAGQVRHRALEFLFLSDRQLNKSFSGSRFSLPIPVAGFFRFSQMRTFSRLSARLQHVLTASPQQLLDENLLSVYIDLLIGELIPSAIAELAGCDEPCRHWLAHYENRTACFEVDGGVSSWLRFESNGAVRVAACSRHLPDAIISFRNRRAALAAIRGELDILAAIGKGDMVVRGMIPLADALGRILDRLGRLLKVCP